MWSPRSLELDQCECGCGKTFQRATGGRRRKWAKDCPNRVERVRETARVWGKRAREAAGPKLCKCGCGRAVTRKWALYAEGCDKHSRRTIREVNAELALEAKEPENDVEPESEGELGACGKRCRVCVGMPHRRPEGRACRCGEFYAEQPPLSILDFMGLPSSAAMAIDAAGSGQRRGPRPKLGRPRVQK